MSLGSSYSEVEIKHIAHKLSVAYWNEMGWRSIDEVRFDLNDFYEAVLYPQFEFELITNVSLGERNGEKVLGKAIPKERVILIDQSISPPTRDPRYAFSWGHEFGHGVLHTETRVAFRCTQLDLFDRTPLSPMEIEANQFASHLLMPDRWVLKKFQMCYEILRQFHYIGPGKYDLTAFGVSNRLQIRSYTHLCVKLGEPLIPCFGDISKTAMGLKIHKLGLVANRTREQFRLWNQSQARPKKTLWDLIAQA